MRHLEQHAVSRWVFRAPSSSATHYSLFSLFISRFDQPNPIPQRYVTSSKDYARECDELDHMVFVPRCD